MHNECPFWRDHSKCSRRNCAVCGQCEDSEVPAPWKQLEHSGGDQGGESEPDPDPIDFTLHRGFKGWSERDASLWIVQDESKDMSYINMQLNPEGYTGYEGESAHRIWSAIYQQNCFSNPEATIVGGEASNKTSDGGVMQPAGLEHLCYEQRVMYRLLSGLHASISCHIASSYPVGDVDPHIDIHSRDGLVGPNLDEWIRRVGAHPDRLTNLYFAFVFMLRAVNKASNTLRAIDYRTGVASEDEALRETLEQVLSSPLVQSCSSAASFDETTMFTGRSEPPAIANGRVNASTLSGKPSSTSSSATRRSTSPSLIRSQLKAAFRNISRIMDCVGCEKCRLHGKLQILGLGTALKILFEDPARVKLERNEVMALIVTLAKFSHALRVVTQMEAMREQLARTGIKALLKPEVWAPGLAAALLIALSCLVLGLRRAYRARSSVREQAARAADQALRKEETTPAALKAANDAANKLLKKQRLAAQGLTQRKQ